MPAHTQPPLGEECINCSRGIPSCHPAVLQGWCFVLLFVQEADGLDHIVEMYGRFCPQEGYVIAHGSVIKVLMEDDHIDWVLCVIHLSGVHVSYTDNSNDLLPREERQQRTFEKARLLGSFTLPSFLIFHVFLFSTWHAHPTQSLGILS